MKQLCLLLAMLMLSGLTGCAKCYPEPPQTNSPVQQSTDSSENESNSEPLIVVTPTFYAPNDRDTSVSNAAEQVAVFHEEFINDLMPAVESHYKTFAKTADSEGLEALRKHKAFGGFSMGSVTTWHQFVWYNDNKGVYRLP